MTLLAKNPLIYMRFTVMNSGIQAERSFWFVSYFLVNVTGRNWFLSSVLIFLMIVIKKDLYHQLSLFILIGVRLFDPHI